MTTVEEILAALPPDGAQPWRMVIDGPSGSGKTTLARQLQRHSGATLLHLDDMYAGWQGLAVGSRTAQELLAGTRKSFRRWDWEHGDWADEVAPDPSTNWIIEGCGAATRAAAKEADLVIWIEANSDVAKERGIGRDGSPFAQWWDVWHQQEVDHWTENDPRSLADLVVRT